HQNTQQYGAILPIELTNEEIRNTKAYKEYYAYATGEAAPKPKANARRKKSGSDSSITPPTAIASPRPTIAATLRLTAAAKAKQPAKATKAKSLSALLEVAMTEAEQLKLALKRSRQQTHISQPGGSGTDEGTGSKPRVLDAPYDGSNEEISWNSSDDEDTDSQEKDRHYDEGDEKDKSFKDDEEEWLNEEEEADELYQDVDINQGRGLQLSQDIEDSHVTLTPVKPDGQQESSSMSSQFVTSMLNPTSDAGVESIFTTASSSVALLPTPTPIMTPSIITTVITASHAPIPLTPIPLTPIPKNDEFLQTIDDNMKRIIKEQVKSQVKEQVSKILPRIEQSVNAQLEAEVVTKSSHSSRTSYADLVEAYEADKIILDTYGERVILKRRRDDDDDQSVEGQPIVQISQHSEWFSQPKKPLTPDRDWNKTLPAAQGSTQTWISELAKQANSRSYFNELLDTLLDFFNFIMNRLRVDTLMPELLAIPTYELMKGSCNSLTELEYHLEEVYKATTDQLDWVNPEGQQYPHNLLHPLSLILDNRGRCVIPFEHFINNDLEDLQGGASSQIYTTSVTKTKATYYGHIKWIEDLKRQQFYGFAVNWESALDVYSKRRIIAVTDLKIMKWHNYKHLDWISVRRDDDKIYKFKEGDFKRLRLQDIKDMLLLLVQGKLSNLTVEERFAFNVSLRMFLRSIVIQRRVEDLQLGYLPQSIWRKGDKDRAAAMIQAIDKMLKTRRIMRSLKRFVGG
nr:hypothetical protein [Tanacetum cinerariifolium]